MMSDTIAIAAPQVAPAMPMSRTVPPVRKASARGAGMLVRRPDLGNDEVLAAITERLTFEGRDPRHAAGVLKAALEGRPVALAFLRRLVLPSPRVPLSMPIQAILRSTPEKSEQRQGTSVWSRFVSFGQ
ncbi:hypothetical protein GCM10011335_04520 [Aureimonas glaciei]|uniref:Uncharacterized protein n=2 Tax=Aureimonas glaciei TaxID=1776957 RepID=A0A917D7S3_9HYPH|nr:hypothetical protein GCM10011335_04520 [Aureimonas glaciei]